MRRLITRREAKMVRWQIGGFEFSFTDLQRLSKIPADALEQRLMRGWDAERAVTTPVRDSVRRWTAPVSERESRAGA